jgi:hypothetical protein
MRRGEIAFWRAFVRNSNVLKMRETGGTAIPQKPDEDWIKAKKYIDSLTEPGLGCVHASVTDQGRIFSVAEDIARRMWRCLRGDFETR